MNVQDRLEAAQATAESIMQRENTDMAPPEQSMGTALPLPEDDDEDYEDDNVDDDVDEEDAEEDGGELALLRSEHEALLHRHRVLEGKYNAEVPRSISEARVAQREAAEWKSKYDEALGVSRDNGGGNEVEDELFDDDTLAAVRRVARKEAEAVAAQTEQRAANQIGKLQESDFFRSLQASVPDWQATHNSQEFKDWLTQKDDLYGSNYDALIKQAAAEFDADRVAAVFHAFKRRAGQQSAPATDEQVMPSHVARSGDDTPRKSGRRQPRVYPLSFRDRVMTDVRRGRYTPEDAQKWLAEFDMAATEGRIVSDEEYSAYGS